MIWFSSDFHLAHKNIIKYSNRPFNSVEEMNDVIIDRCNEKILPDDTLYFLGDFLFARKDPWDEILRFRYKINCKNFHFILGNHDKYIRKYVDYLLMYKHFNSIQDVLEIKDTTPRIWLSHYAHLTWPRMHYGAYHLYAHSHGSLPDNPNSLSFDVGVDTNNFYPYSWEDVQKKMSKKTFRPVDHHTGERQ